MNKRILISKINSVGSMRNNSSFSKRSDNISGNSLNANRPYCSIDNDNITTYVQKKVWVVEKSIYQYPPYVECEYVE